MQKYLNQIITFICRMSCLAKSFEIHETRRLNQNAVGDIGSPILTTVFNVLGVLSLLGSIVIANILWPESTSYDKNIAIVNYLSSIVWIVSGVIEWSLFIAIGQVLKYLNKIAEISSRTRAT